MHARCCVRIFFVASVLKIFFNPLGICFLAAWFFLVFARRVWENSQWKCTLRRENFYILLQLSSRSLIFRSKTVRATTIILGGFCWYCTRIIIFFIRIFLSLYTLWSDCDFFSENFTQRNFCDLGLLWWHIPLAVWRNASSFWFLIGGKWFLVLEG